MVKRLKYKIINPRTGRTVHHSFNKKNAEKWVKNYGKQRTYSIKKIKK
jgi:hypothetical protein